MLMIQQCRMAKVRACWRRADHRSRHDQLTGLPNRALLDRRLSGGMPKALLFIDLDDFKDINDSCGHLAGDAVLRAFAAKLKALARDGLVARIGGDEFAILMEGASAAAHAAQLARLITAHLRTPLLLPDGEVMLSASIGIAASDCAAEAGPELFRRADLAMYAAKAAGGGTQVTCGSAIAAVKRSAGHSRLHLAGCSQFERPILTIPVNAGHHLRVVSRTG
jgi:diguanylate cyclase (GGDEF)-like protein